MNRAPMHLRTHLSLALMIATASVVVAATSAGPAAATAPTEPVFAPALDLSLPLSQTSPMSTASVLVTDLDGDGRDDLANLMDPDYGTDTNTYVHYYLQQPDGSLSQRTEMTVAQSAASRMAAADLIPGGGKELMVMDNSGIRFLSYTDGTLNQVGSLSLALTQLQDLEIAELTGDSKLDLLVTSGDGIWMIPDPLTPSPTVSQITTSPGPMDAAELTGDGAADIAVAGPTPGVLAGNGDGTFDTLVPLPSATAGMDVVAGDLDSDGDQDLVLSGPWGTRVFRQDAGAMVADAETYTYSDPYWYWDGVISSPLVDLNNDGRPDIAESHTWYNGHVVIRLQDTDARFATEFTFPGSDNYSPGQTALASGDLDGDDLTDFVERVHRGVLVHMQLPPGSKSRTVSGISGSGGDSTTPNTITGQVDLPDGGVPIDGTIDIERTNPDGSSTNLQAPIIDGRWKLDDQTSIGGDFIYAATWPGDAIHTGSTSRDLAITTARGPTSISASFSRDRLRYGQSVEVSFELIGAPPGSDVELWAEPVDSLTPLYMGTYLAEPGQLTTFTMMPPASGIYRLTYDGGDWAAGSSDRTQVAVQADVVGKMLKGRKQGKYHTYSPGNRIYYLTEVRPSHPGSEATIEFEAKVGRWRFAGSYDVTLNADGVGGAVLKASKLPPGVPFRVSTRFYRDDCHLPDTSKPQYFMVLAGRYPEIGVGIGEDQTSNVDWATPQTSSWWSDLGIHPPVQINRDPG